MIRYAYLLCAIIVIGACFACAPLPPAPPIQPTTASCSVGDPNFLNHVLFVQNGLPLPSSNPNNPPAPPQPANATPVVGTPYAQALQNAFQLAPQAFRDRLCGLTGIYVNGPAICSSLSDCIENSWGFRVWQNFPLMPQTYVAITAGLWNLSCPGASPGSAYIYHCFETNLLNKVAGTDASQYFQYGSANTPADNFDMTILAALAHEVAHAQWYRVMAPNGPGILGYTPGFCGSPDFFSYSWKERPVHKPPVWRLFLTLDKRNHNFGPPDHHLVAPQTKAVDNAVNANNLGHAADFLEQLYRPGQPWASYFGSISPDEDFVETYKFYVLTNVKTVPGLVDPHGVLEGPLTSLPIVLNGIKHDIPTDYLVVPTNKPSLFSKIQCIAPNI
jgi:hypothetical protein